MSSSLDIEVQVGNFDVDVLLDTSGGPVIFPVKVLYILHGEWHGISLWHKCCDTIDDALLGRWCSWACVLSALPVSPTLKLWYFLSSCPPSQVTLYTLLQVSSLFAGYCGHQQLPEGVAKFEVSAASVISEDPAELIS